jgi:hypothetical protein
MDGVDKLSHVFCHILLRPPWEKIMWVGGIDGGMDGWMDWTLVSHTYSGLIEWKLMDWLVDDWLVIWLFD